MNFCAECNNLLYPHGSERQLKFRCKHCTHTEVATNNCVYSNHITADTSKGSTLFVNREITQDPALPRMNDIPCPSCKGMESVFLTMGSGKNNDDAMKLVFVCCNKECGHWWRQN